jgi:hypothetical protein
MPVPQVDGRCLVATLALQAASRRSGVSIIDQPINDWRGHEYGAT